MPLHHRKPPSTLPVATDSDRIVLRRPLQDDHRVPHHRPRLDIVDRNLPLAKQRGQQKNRDHALSVQEIALGYQPFHA